MYTVGYVVSLDGENETRDFSLGGFDLIMHKGKKFVAWLDCLKECVRFLKPSLGDMWIETHREQGGGIKRATKIFREKYNAGQVVDALGRQAHA
jgi:hypothetical protein